MDTQDMEQAETKKFKVVIWEAPKSPDAGKSFKVVHVPSPKQATRQERDAAVSIHPGFFTMQWEWKQLVGRYSGLETFWLMVRKTPVQGVYVPVPAEYAPPPKGASRWRRIRQSSFTSGGALWRGSGVR